MTKKYMILVSGPTAVGKTDFVDQLSQAIPSQIINGDMGQLYSPLSIGTAKPDLTTTKVPHHLFGVVDKPQSITVSEYYNAILPLMNQIWDQGQVPIIVGGSLFYLQSLLFPPHAVSTTDINLRDIQDPSWQALHEVDPERAAQIHPNDTYRIARALAIWHTTGVKPSTYKSVYNPVAPYLFIYLDRDRKDLYSRIDARVYDMIDQGWIEEVDSLMGTEWENFVVNKGILGYPELVSYCKEDKTPENRAATIAKIQQETRNYAKRQGTFWRGLYKKIYEYTRESQDAYVEYVNLTFTNHSLYINQLLQKLSNTLFL